MAMTMKNTMSFLATPTSYGKNDIKPSLAHPINLLWLASLFNLLFAYPGEKLPIKQKREIAAPIISTNI
jgi:hypothetical protein